VWGEFSDDLPRLRRVAEAIRRTADLKNHEDFPKEADGFLEAPEGRLLTRLHRVHERSKVLTAAKKAAALKRTRSLACEACGFDFREKYGFAEAHHLVPVEQLSCPGP
jgi:5-methylcytosine-specific restriction protein A